MKVKSKPKKEPKAVEEEVPQPYVQEDPILEVLDTVDMSQYENTPEIKEMITRIDKALPDEVIAKLEAMGQSLDQMQWTIGDLVNIVYDIVTVSDVRNKKNVSYTFLDVCYYVSVRYLNGTRSLNTIKAWALTSRRFPKKVRNKYQSTSLPFSHFTYAAKRQFDVQSPTSGEKVWQDILNFSIEFSSTHARNCSVRDLEDKFEKKPNRLAPKSSFIAGTLPVEPLDMSVYQPAIGAPEIEEGNLHTDAVQLMQMMSSFMHRFSAKFPTSSDPLRNLYSSLYRLISSALGDINT